MKILVLSSHTQSLFWFRLDMMRAFMGRGAKVIAVGSESASYWSEKFAKYGIEYRSIPVSRNGMNIFGDIKTFFALRKLIREINPDKIFTYQAKTIVYGSLAAAKSIDIYPLIAGLGSIFRGSGLKNNIVKAILSLQYKFAFKRAKVVIFQNRDDSSELISRKLLPEEKTAIVRGSGVNTKKFETTSLPDQKTILYIGRLIRDKGINEYLALAQRLHDQNSGTRCLLVGPFDTNPSALKPEELKPYIEKGIIEYFGEQQDVRPYIAQCSVYVLPSYHEGTPKTVLESMAMGRPIVTTDAPGCRETVVDGENGYLVPVRNVDALERAVKKVLDSPVLAQNLGKKSRYMAEEIFDVERVNASIMKIMDL